MRVRPTGKKAEDQRRKHKDYNYSFGKKCDGCGKSITNATKTGKCCSCSRIGKKLTEEHKKNVGIAQLGRKASRKTIEKMRKSHPPKDEVIIDAKGYRRIYSPDHPRSRSGMPRVREQVLVMERHLGRYLNEGEIVHHINCDKKDNRIENLMIVTASEHSKIHKRIRKE